jgi:hypothetical protein
MTKHSLGYARALGLLALAALAGCGYTQLRGAQSGAPPADTTGVPMGADSTLPGETYGGMELPVGHPRILNDADWAGRSFLDDLLGVDAPLRFENLRTHPRARDPLPHSEITIRMTVGGPAVSQVWQIRMDQFGWVTAAYWTQGEAGPRLDESLATQRNEFRLARESESALREMLIELFPIGENAEVQHPALQPNYPIDLWPYENPGRIDIDYRVETLTTASPDDWPGGSVSAPLDLVQLLITTWDGVPPRELRAIAYGLAREQPTLIDVAVLAEGLVLAWEVEGYGIPDRLELPLRVGR